MSNYYIVSSEAFLFLNLYIIPFVSNKMDIVIGYMLLPLSRKTKFMKNNIHRNSLRMTHFRLINYVYNLFEKCNLFLQNISKRF